MNHMAKYFIITSSKNSQIAKKASLVFPQAGIINFGLLYEQNMKVFVKVSNHFTKYKNEYNVEVLLRNRTGLHQSSGYLTSTVFPDKLQNLNGYKYNIIYHIGMKDVHFTNRRDLVAKNLFFFESAAISQNAYLKLIPIGASKPGSIFRIMRNLVQSNITFVTLDESFTEDDQTMKILTFEEKAICALIPSTIKKFHSKFSIYPRDQYIVIVFAIALTAVYIVLRAYRSRGTVHSPGYLLYVVYANFIGQGLRQNRNMRRILIIMLQIFFFSSIFLKMMYESEITSQTIYYDSDEKYSNIENLIKERDSNVMIGSKVDVFLKTIDDRISSHNLIKHEPGSFMRPYDYIKGNIGIFECIVTDKFLRTIPQNTHYLLPQKFMTSYYRLETATLSPFTERLQEIMNRAFDTGLTQKWNSLYLTKLFGTRSGNLKSLEKRDKNHENLITFSGLMQLFTFVLYLYGTCILVFFCEIFWHGSLRHLSWALILNIFRLQCIKKAWNWRFFWKRRRVLIGRRIQVRPINV